MMFEYQQQLPLVFRKNGLFSGYTKYSIGKLDVHDDIVKIINTFDTGLTDFVFDNQINYITSKSGMV